MAITNDLAVVIGQPSQMASSFTSGSIRGAGGRGVRNPGPSLTLSPKSGEGTKEKRATNEIHLHPRQCAREKFYRNPVGWPRTRWRSLLAGTIPASDAC